MKKIILTAILAFTIQFGSYGQGASLVGLTANSIVDNFSNRIQDVLAEMDAVLTKQTFDIRQHASILTDQLDFIVDQNINKVFSKLSKEQQALLTNMEVLIASMENSGVLLIKSADELLDKANALAGTLPFSKKAPTITAVSRSYFQQFDLTNVFSVKGTWLGTGKPYITFGGENYFPLSKLDAKLEFELPFDKFADSNEIVTISAELVVFQKKFLRKISKKYRLLFFIVPDKFGSYKLYTKVIEDQRIEKSRTKNFSYRNGHCEGARTRLWTFNPQGAEWKIDVNTIHAQASSVSRESQFRGVRNEGPRGFQVEARIGNHGNCVRVAGQTISRDARGSVSGHVNWVEYRVNQKSVNKGLISEGELSWGEDIIFELPANLDAFTLEIDQMDGKHKIITGNEISDWFKVTYTTNPNRIVLKPFDLDTVLSQ